MNLSALSMQIKMYTNIWMKLNKMITEMHIWFVVTLEKQQRLFHLKKTLSFGKKTTYSF